MKNIALILFIIILSSLIQAVPTLNFQHNQTQSGETILATITTTGEFAKPIRFSDISFYEGRKEVPFESDIAFYNGTYYFYIYANREGNFSIHISNILYKEAGELKSTTIIKHFSILDKIITDAKTNKTSKEILSIKPGFVFSAIRPKIKLTNVGTTTLNLTYEGNKTSLAPMETEEVSFTPTKEFSYFNISSYEKFSIPIIYFSKKNISKNSTIKMAGLKQNPKLLFAELYINNKSEKTIQLINFGDRNATDISAKTGISFIKVSSVGDIGGKKTGNLTFIFDATDAGHFKGYINVSYKQYGEKHLLLIPVSLFVIPKNNNFTNFTKSEKTCKELSGNICKDGEICDSKATFTEDEEYCCLGNCQKQKTKSTDAGYGWIIGLAILLAIGATGYYFYKKQKRVVPKKPDEQIEEISKKFRERMTGGKRISGGLTKS